MRGRVRGLGLFARLETKLVMDLSSGLGLGLGLTTTLARRALR